MKRVLFCLIMGCFAFAQQYFPISAFHVDDTLWFQGAGADSLGLNHIWLGGPERNENVKLAKLNAAYRYNLKATLYNATRGNQEGTPDWNPNEILWYARLFWTNWEVDSSNFYQYTGSLVSDPQAQGGDAWKATVGASVIGPMIQGPKRGTRNRVLDTCAVHFLLKVDSLGEPSVKVCSLWIKWKKGDYWYTKQKVVCVGDFDSAGVYLDITVPYYNNIMSIICTTAFIGTAIEICG